MRTVDLPVPFQVGDLLEIDCTPYAPVKHAVVLSEDMQILFLDAHGDLCIDHLESGCIFGTGNRNIIPPLYGADLVKHIDEDFLEDLRNYIVGNENRAERILHDFREYSDGSNRLQQADLLRLMEENGEDMSYRF